MSFLTSIRSQTSISPLYFNKHDYLQGGSIITAVNIIAPRSINPLPKATSYIPAGE